MGGGGRLVRVNGVGYLSFYSPLVDHHHSVIPHAPGKAYPMFSLFFHGLMVELPLVGSYGLSMLKPLYY